jgi:TolA-binding protein
MSGGGEKRWLDDAADPGRRAARQALDEAAARLPGNDELARQRVWARVQAPWAGRGTRRWPLIVGLAAAALAVVAGARFLRRTELVARAPLARPIPTTGATAIESAGSPARHQLAGGVEADLSPGTALVPGDAVLSPEVKRGRVRFSVPHQAPGRRYAVRAGAYRVAVLGTVFDVAVDEDRVRVSVSSGVVQVEEAATGRRLERLAPGEEWSSAPAEAPVPAPAPPRPAVRAPAPRRPVESAPVDPAATRALAEARGARRAGDPRRALQLYNRLVGAGGPLAESALFEMASIQHEDLHDAGKALELWQRYRDRYPRGLLRAEADLYVIEALPRVGNDARALEEARAFLRRYPRSERRGEVARVAADLARTRGDCRGALDLYETAARASLSSRDADDAAFGRAACLSALGDGGAPQAARDYLRRFPSGRHAAEAARLP